MSARRPMTEADAAVRFIRVVGWVFLVLAAFGVLVAGAQVLMLSQAAPGLPVDGRARGVSVGLAVSCSLVVAVSVAFLRQRRWALPALSAITAVAFVGSVIRVVVPSRPIEALPPEAPAEYLRLLRVVALGDVAVSVLVGLASVWLLWRLRSPAVRDQFR